MIKKVSYERLEIANIKIDDMPVMTVAQKILAAEKMTRIIEERAKRRERGESIPEDDIEVFTEWV